MPDEPVLSTHEKKGPRRVPFRDSGYTMRYSAEVYARFTAESTGTPGLIVEATVMDFT